LEKESLKEKIRDEKRSETAQQLDFALRRIKGASIALYVIAALQILSSGGFQTWLGVAFGILMVVLTLLVQLKKSASAGLAISALGGLSIIVNFLGPMVTGAKFGNSVLSILVLWLGIRCYRNIRVLRDNTLSN
jgi:hypothetical protein